MPVDQNHVEVVKTWIKSQKNAVQQCESNIAYSEIEIAFNEGNIKNQKELIKHYQASIEKAQKELDAYINDNQ